MALISETNPESQCLITFEKSPSYVNKAIALLNANILDNSSRGQSRLVVFILGTRIIGLLERITSSPREVNEQVRI